MIDFSSNLKWGRDASSGVGRPGKEPMLGQMVERSGDEPHSSDQVQRGERQELCRLVPSKTSRWWDEINDGLWLNDWFNDSLILAIIEYVRDGSTVRCLLLPSYYHVTVQLSGVKCPGFKREADNTETPEPFADEAKQFVEARLLQRDVKVILEGVANQTSGILVGTILHPVRLKILYFDLNYSGICYCFVAY